MTGKSTFWRACAVASLIVSLPTVGSSAIVATSNTGLINSAPGKLAPQIPNQTVQRATPAIQLARNTTSTHNKSSDGQEASKQSAAGEEAYFAFDQGKYLTALELAKKAAADGSAAAHTLVGRIFSEGRGVSRNQKEAATWYARGAELGDTNAAFAYGLLLIKGSGVKKDADKASEMFEQAARTGHPAANYNLGLLFLSGQGKPENPYRAKQHIAYAAEQGIVVAQYDLAGLYQNGTGTDPDALEASRWLSKAANAGLAAAQFEYAVMLLRGLGLKVDAPKAVSYLLQAAEQGVAGAQNRLAHVYAEGAGVEKNLQEAAKWSFIAKANGMTDITIDEKISGLTPKQRQAAEKAALAWTEKRSTGIPDIAAP